MSRFEIRTGFFQHIYGTLVRTAPELFRGSSFDAEDEAYLIALYFAMSDAYKIFRVEPGHRTNDSKKAAITIAAVMAMRPIQFPHAPLTKHAFYLNPIFALACSTAIMRKPLHTGQSEDRDQLYMSFDRLRFPSTASLLTELQAEKMVRQQESIDLTLTYDEISAIDLIVRELKHLSRCYDLEQQIRDMSTDP